MAIKAIIETKACSKYATILRSLITASNAAESVGDYALLDALLQLEDKVEDVYVKLLKKR